MTNKQQFHFIKERKGDDTKNEKKIQYNIGLQFIFLSVAKFS